MGEYNHLFGPVPSRRLGRSLGVDLTPYKTCSQDCVFCQLGRTPSKTITRREYVPVKAVFDELGKWMKRGGKADHITLSGSGEPTLHSRFGEVLRFVRMNSAIKAVLLTNGSLFHLPEVRRQALQAHIVKVSLSAWDRASYDWVNRPHPDLDFEQLIEGQKSFREEFKGEMWIEVFLVAGMNSIPSDVAKIAALVDLLKPDRIHLNTAVRPPAEDFVAPLSRERLVSLCDLFRPSAEVIAGYKDKGCFEIQTNKEAIISMLKRRPCTAEEIAGAFGMHLNEVSKYLGNLLRQRRIRAERSSGSPYFVAAFTEWIGSYPRVNTVRKDTASAFEVPRAFREGYGEQELKGKMLKDEKDFFSPSAYERWLHPTYRGSMDNPDGHACLTGKCGETIEMSLKFDGEHVSQAAFETDGCAAITVCGSFAAEMAIGKSPEEILEITGETIMKTVGSFPKEEAHCAFLAAETLQEALHNFMIKETGSRKPREEKNHVEK